MTETPTIAENASAEDVFAHFSQPAAPEPAASAPTNEPAKTEKTEPAPSTKTDLKSDIEIPDSILGINKEVQAEPDLDAILGEEIKGQVKHEHFKRVKDAAKRKAELLAAERDQFKAELEKYKTSPVPDEIKTELESYKTKISEYEQILEREAVQKSPKFHELYTKKEKLISERVERTAKEAGLDNELIQNALNSGLKRRSEILDGMDLSTTVRGALDHLMVQHDLLQDDKDKFLEQSGEAYRSWQAEEKARMEAGEKERSQREEQVFKSIGDEISKSYAPYQKVEGNEKWNAQVDLLKSEAQKYFNGQLPLEDLARVVYKGVGAQAQEAIIAKLHAKIQEQASELDALKVAQPNANGAATNATQQTQTKPYTRESYEETFNRARAGLLNPENAGAGNGMRL